MPANTARQLGIAGLARVANAKGKHGLRAVVEQTVGGQVLETIPHEET